VGSWFRKPRALTSAAVGGCGAGGGITPKASPPGKRSSRIASAGRGRAGASWSRYYNRYTTTTV